MSKSKSSKSFRVAAIVRSSIGCCLELAEDSPRLQEYFGLCGRTRHMAMAMVPVAFRVRKAEDLHWYDRVGELRVNPTYRVDVWTEGGVHVRMEMLDVGEFGGFARWEPLRVDLRETGDSGNGWTALPNAILRRIGIGFFGN